MNNYLLYFTVGWSSLDFINYPVRKKKEEDDMKLISKHAKSTWSFFQVYNYDMSQIFIIRVCILLWYFFYGKPKTPISKLCLFMLMPLRRAAAIDRDRNRETHIYIYYECGKTGLDQRNYKFFLDLQLYKQSIMSSIRAIVWCVMYFAVLYSHISIFLYIHQGFPYF